MLFRVDKRDFFIISSQEFIKIFLFRVSMNLYKDWKAKLERAHFFKIRSDRITVCDSIFVDPFMLFSELSPHKSSYHKSSYICHEIS